MAMGVWALVAASTVSVVLFLWSRSAARPIIAVPLVGRIGNQLFQMVSARGIAQHNNATACYIDYFKESVGTLVQTLPIQRCPWGVTVSSRLGLVQAHTESRATRFEMPRTTGSVNHVGRHLQSYKYFGSPHIPTLLPLRRAYFDRAQATLRRYTANQSGVHTVGVHVRRTDQVRGGLCNMPTADYFNATIQYFRRKYRRVHFFVVSDDVGFCRCQRVFDPPNPVTILDTQDAHLDLAILSQCRHVVL